MAKILYIAGYGRSGSTILGIMLGNHSEIVSIGAVSNLLNDWADSTRLCACGEPYPACKFWRHFLRDSFPEELSQIARRVERAIFLPRLLSNLISNEERLIYANYQRHLFQYVESRARKPIIVDSSKSARARAGRFLSLHRLAHQDVYVLHLVRNGLDTMASLVVTGSNWALEDYASPPKLPAVRSVVGWVSANVWASLLGRMLGPGHYLRMHYEDLLTDPAAALRRVGRFCSFDPEELIERINLDDYFQVGHSVGGNRLRLQGQVKLWKSYTLPRREGLKVHHRLLFAILGGWLQRRYGYLG